MPSYEAAIIFKSIERPQLVQAVKRAAGVILQNGGVVRSFENLGARSLPYRMQKHGEKHKEGTYFIINFDSPSALLYTMRDHCRRDTDIIRPRILRREVELGRPCDREQCEFGEMNEDLRKKLKINLNEFIKKL